jgi:cell division protein FtsL
MGFWKSLIAQRFYGVLLIQIIAFVIVVLVFVWVTLSKAMVNEDIKLQQSLKLEIAREQEQLNSLRLEVAQLERPERLDRLARDKLGLTPVSPEKQAHVDSLSELSKSTRPADQTAMAELMPKAESTAQNESINGDGSQIPTKATTPNAKDINRQDQ